MASPQDEVTIRSFRLAFELERRIFKVDRWRLPFAYGVALRSIGYAAAALAAIVVLARLPGAGAALAVVPAPLKFVVAPLAAAYALTRVDIDGRPAHRVAAAWARHVAARGRLAAFRRIDAPGRPALLAALTLAADERSARYRRAVVRGPATILVRYPARARPRGATLRLRQTSTVPLRRARTIEVGSGQRVVFR
jgi:hypothetical protein